MKFVNENYVRSQRSAGGCVDIGLRKYLTAVFGYMGAALGVTGLVALIVYSSDGLMSAIHDTPLKWFVTFAPIAITFFMSYKINKLSTSEVIALFFGFSCLMGMSLSYIFILWKTISIARIFFISASLFGVMAIYGNTTDRDLSSFGSFFMMGVVGLIIASVINIFMHSSNFQFAISLVSVVLFTGLTAYDVQRLKTIYANSGVLNASSDNSYLKKIALIGATSLYFNFINIFLNLLQLFGDRK